jgi:hypothetical protein
MKRYASHQLKGDLNNRIDDNLPLLAPEVQELVIEDIGEEMGNSSPRGHVHSASLATATDSKLRAIASKNHISFPHLKKLQERSQGPLRMLTNENTTVAQMRAVFGDGIEGSMMALAHFVTFKTKCWIYGGFLR